MARRRAAAAAGDIAAAPTMRVSILHGSADEIVPVEMGRALAKQAKAVQKQLTAAVFRASYKEVRGGDHNRVLGRAQKHIFAAMRRGSKKKTSEKMMKDKKPARRHRQAQKRPSF